MTLNGALAGFVSITTPCDGVTPIGAILIGIVGSALATGLINMESGLFYGGGFKKLGVQILVVGAAFIWAFGLGLLLFYAISKTIGLRVTYEEEMKGLDIGEHGMEAYSGFQVFTTT